MSTMSFTYYDRLISHASASFVYLILTREHIEDDLKTEKIKIIRRFLSSHMVER